MDLVLILVLPVLLTIALSILTKNPALLGFLLPLGVSASFLGLAHTWRLPQNTMLTVTLDVTFFLVEIVAISACLYAGRRSLWSALALGACCLLAGLASLGALLYALEGSAFAL